MATRTQAGSAEITQHKRRRTYKYSTRPRHVVVTNDTPESGSANSAAPARASKQAVNHNHKGRWRSAFPRAGQQRSRRQQEVSASERPPRPRPRPRPPPLPPLPGAFLLEPLSLPRRRLRAPPLLRLRPLVGSHLGPLRPRRQRRRRQLLAPPPPCLVRLPLLLPQV